MRIENSDIDALIEVSIWLKAMAEVPVYCESRKKFEELRQRTRKVYILLLNATQNGQLELKRLCEKGVDDNSPTAEAIRRLCPDLGLNR